MNTTVELNISSKKIKNCKEVIDILRKCKISGKVSSNKTLICNDSECWEEKGCDITITKPCSKEDIKTIWKPLQKKFGLNCAHLNIHGHYIGCILNFIRSSNCPGPIKDGI